MKKKALGKGFKAVICDDEPTVIYDPKPYSNPLLDIIIYMTLTSGVLMALLAVSVYLRIIN